jgi:hypothetical protein
LDFVKKQPVKDTKNGQIFTEQINVKNVSLRMSVVEKEKNLDVEMRE